MLAMPLIQSEFKPNRLLKVKKCLSYECLKHGWILTGYPRNVMEFRMLDMTETPPNRVIFVEVSPKECFLRVHYRAVDSCFGDKYRPDDVKPNAWGDHQLQGNARGISGWMKIHPKDRKEKVIHDIEDYFLCKNEMIEYCGRTAGKVNGAKPIQVVFEHIDQILINSAPACKLRRPMLIGEDSTEYGGYRSVRKTGQRFRVLTSKEAATVEEVVCEIKVTPEGSEDFELRIPCKSEEEEPNPCSEECSTV